MGYAFLCIIIQRKDYYIKASILPSSFLVELPNL